MKFYFVSKDGKERRELNDEEVREHMSEYQIGEAIEAKRNDHNEYVCYMTDGGYIVVE